MLCLKGEETGGISIRTKKEETHKDNDDYNDEKKMRKKMIRLKDV